MASAARRGPRCRPPRANAHAGRRVRLRAAAPVCAPDRGFGADVVVPRGPAFAAAVREAAPDGADGLLDAALLSRDAFGAIRDGGAMAVVRGWDDSPTERGIEIRPVWVRTVLDRTDWLERLRDRAAAGRLALRVAAEYPPEDAAQAHELMDSGGLRGRAVIVF